MKKSDVVILAGDKKASVLVRNDNKAFLEINRIPSIVYVLRAFLGSECTKDIIVVGPADRLKGVLREFDLLKRGRIRIIEQKESLIANGKAGFIASLDGLPDDSDFDSIDRRKYGDVVVVFASCDIPLITPQEIDEFILKADMDAFDYYIGLCGDEVLEHYYPDAENPGIRMAYFTLREGNYRVNNLQIAKPLKIERLKYIEQMYEIRYQRRLGNLLKLLLRIVCSGRAVLKTMYYAVKLRLALYFFDRRRMAVYRRIKESIRIDKICVSIGRILGTRISYRTTHYGGAALDIDHPEDRDTVEKMFDRWIAYQNDLKIKDG